MHHLIAKLFGRSLSDDIEAEPVHTTDAEFIDFFLRWKFKRSIKKDIPLIIIDHFTIDDFFICKEVSPSPEELIVQAEKKNRKLGEAIHELIRKNVASTPLDAIGKFDINHITITEERKNEIFKRGFWEEFYKTFPKSPGFIYLSLPAFSRDGTIAAIYMGHRWNMLAARGDIYIFEHKRGKWCKSKMRLTGGWGS